MNTKTLSRTHSGSNLRIKSPPASHLRSGAVVSPHLQAGMSAGTAAYDDPSLMGECRQQDRKAAPINTFMQPDTIAKRALPAKAFDTRTTRKKAARTYPRVVASRVEDVCDELAT